MNEMQRTKYFMYRLEFTEEAQEALGKPVTAEGTDMADALRRAKATSRLVRRHMKNLVNCRKLGQSK